MATASKKDDTTEIRLLVPRMVPVRVARVVEVRNGEQITKVETFYKACMADATLIAEDIDVRVSRKDGKPIAPAALLQLLRKETPVLVFADGEPDAYYLQVVDERAVIITIPKTRPFPWRPKEDD